MFLDNENYKLLLIIPCKIENMTLNIYIAISNFFKLRIVAGSVPYKSKNLGIKISHGCREIVYCPVGYYNLSHPVYLSTRLCDGLYTHVSNCNVVYRKHSLT